MFVSRRKSQSLRNQGFIRTRVVVRFHKETGSQSLRNQGFIRTAPTVNGFSLLSSRGSVPILSVLS